MTKKRLSIASMIVCLSAVTVFSAALPAQSPEGALVGTVIDSSNARIAGATVKASAKGFPLVRSVETNSAGEFRIESLAPGSYNITVEARGFGTNTGTVSVAVNSVPTLNVKLQPATVQQTLNVTATAESITAEPIETSSSVVKGTVGREDLESIPLAHRSFANIAYLVPMTEPVEPSDPTKARITAVSFGGSSGLNVDLSVDGGDNNDD